jgi:hypothetical protein
MAALSRIGRSALRVLLLNGPPRCGKDTLGRILHEELTQRGVSASLESFKDTLIDSACRRYGVDRLQFMHRYEVDKERPVAWLCTSSDGLPLSRRQALIHHSEHEMKPQLGSDIFVRLWYAAQINRANAAVDQNHVFIFTDCGFDIEVLALMTYNLNVHVVHVRRPGTNFAGDSRTYVQPPPTVRFSVIDNDNDLEHLRMSAINLLHADFF